MTIIRDLSLLDPKFAAICKRLDERLTAAYETGVTKTCFKVFETYRDPARQADLFAKGTTKARAFASAHQLGLACDFVPYLTAEEAAELSNRIGERVWPGWNWHSSNDYRFLKTQALAVGLVVPIAWDPCHVEHPNWQAFRKCQKQHFGY